MRLRVALKLLSRERPQSFALRRRRDELGAIWTFIRIGGDLLRAERRVIRARCRRGVHNVQPIDKLQTFAACVWCWAPKTKVFLVDDEETQRRRMRDCWTPACCRDRAAGCWCAIGWPLILTCADCRRIRTHADDASYCVCPPPPEARLS